MKNLIFIYLAFLSVPLIASPHRQEAGILRDTTGISFQLSEIPVVLTEPTERCAWLLEHFWDKFNFADTNLIHHPEVSEQAFADFISVLPHGRPADIEKGIGILMKKAAYSPKIFNYFAGLAEKYLYDPNSPARNDELYIPFLEKLLSSPILSRTDKIRPAYQLEMAQKNRPGTIATDFDYTLLSGKQQSLLQTPAEYLLLVFYDPECDHCQEILQRLITSSAIHQLIARHKLTVLAIYTEANIPYWQSQRQQLPANWIVGHDREKIKNQNLYDLKAMPSLYLLNRTKQVLLKDTSLPVLFQKLTEIH